MYDDDDDDASCLGCCCWCLAKSCVGCLACALNFACSVCGLLIGVVLICVLVPAFGVVYPVRATVKDASVSRLALAAGANNGTGTAALAYDLSLTVSLRNRNWAMRAELAAPLDAELRFAGTRLEGARLADAGMRMDPRHREEFRMLAVSSSSPPVGSELSGDAAAEFARQTVAGVAEFELRLTGAFKYRPVLVGGSRRLDVRCPLKLPVALPPSPASAGTHFMSTVSDKVSITCY